MVEHIVCRSCNSPNCKGCNIHVLSEMLLSGKFDFLLDETHCINPAADVVEVVRCKECKYSMLWRKPHEKVIGECSIRKWNSDDEQFCMVGDDDFCSYGERRCD